jgi:hypothetical protein
MAALAALCRCASSACAGALGASVACTDGQVVRCRVLAQRHADKRLLLTLLTLDESRATRSSASGLAGRHRARRSRRLVRATAS